MSVADDRAAREYEEMQQELRELRPLKKLLEDVQHYSRVAKNHREVEAEGDKEWDYLYRAPHEMWNRRSTMIGRSAVRAYWLPNGPRQVYEPVQPAHAYSFRFKEITDVVIGPHAYTLVFADGSNEALCSYDTVCIRLPRI